MKLSEKRSILLLVLFLAVASWLLYQSTVFLPPSFIHAWTQSERYAVSLQFLNNGFDLFHPATFNLQTVDGVTRMDLPMNEFIVALLMKIFGTSPFIFRMYTISVSITGLIFLYLLAKRLTGSELKSWLVVLFVFLSPVYTYYQAGFIPCVPAASLVFIAYYFFYSYKTDGIKKHFYLCLLFFFLAAMIRMPFFIFLFAFFLQQAYAVLTQKKLIRFELWGFAVAFGLFIGYSLYNIHLGKAYGNMFLDRFLPAKSFGELITIIRYIYRHWLFQYFTFWHYFLLIGSILCTFFAAKKARAIKEKALWFNLLIVGSGAILYFLLMACQYFDHDYYFIDSLFIPVVLLFLLTVRNVDISRQKHELAFFFVSGICLCFMYGDASTNQKARYRPDGSDRSEITRRNFEGSEQFLDSVGISADARILVIDSYSTNVPLYMMNRRGYTVYQTNRDNPLPALFQAEWDYVVIQDQFLFSDVLRYYPVVATVLRPLVGNGKITIYERNKEFKTRTVEELLQLNYREKLVEETADFDGDQKGHFTTTDNLAYSDDQSAVALLSSEIEFGITFKVGANELKNHKNVSVKVGFDFYSEDLSGFKLVATTANNGKTIQYQSHTLSDFYAGAKQKQQAMFYFVLPEFHNANDILSVYLWNPEKKKMQYDNFRVTVYSAQRSGMPLPFR